MKNTILFLFWIMFFLSCNEVEKSEEATIQANTTQGSTYDYYPRANIYYDIEQKHYLVFDSAQNVWQQKNNLSTEENAFLSKKVVITNPSLPVYQANDNHRLVYGAALYSSSEEIRKKFKEDSLKLENAKKRRLADSLKMSNAKKDSTVTENKKKRKNGLKNFFDKIFKKKSEKALPSAK